MRLTPLISLATLAAASSLPVDTNLVSRDTKASYDGYHVYSVTPSSSEDVHAIEKRFEKYHTQHLRDTLSVAVPPEELDKFKALGLEARLVSSDLGKYIRDTEGKAPTYNKALHKRGELPDLSWYDSYHDYADHLDYWDDFVSAFPDNSEKFEIGQSYENRTIYAFHLFGDEEKGHKGRGKGRGKGRDKGGKHGKKEEEKPVILWHATVHAREVSHLTCLLLKSSD